MGWAESFASELLDEPKAFLTHLAHQIGKICPGRRGEPIEVLHPRDCNAAFPRSLSVNYGLSCLPLHTDGAHLPAPPRFIILACLNPGAMPIPTALVHSMDLGIDVNAANLFRSATFLVKNGRRSFYSSIFDRVGNSIRFDIGCMSPVSPEASQAQTKLLTAISSVHRTLIDWRAGDVAIIDNWKVLHGRGTATMKTSEDRTMMRVAIQ